MTASLEWIGITVGTCFIVTTIWNKRHGPSVGGQICDICISVIRSKFLIIFRKFQNFFPLVNSACQKATVFLLLPSRMHNLNLALREVSTAAYDEQQTHLW
jgi:hypothetical protein